MKRMANKTVTAGNPNLDPYRARTYDLAVEWYFAQDSLLSAAACEYWDGRREAIRGGVIASGVSERFIGVVIRAIRLFVHDEQSEFAALLLSLTLG